MLILFYKVSTKSGYMGVFYFICLGYFSSP